MSLGSQSNGMPTPNLGSTLQPVNSQPSFRPSSIRLASRPPFGAPTAAASVQPLPSAPPLEQYTLAGRVIEGVITNDRVNGEIQFTQI